MPTIDLPEQEILSILVDDLDRHPSTIAWRQVSGYNSTPQMIQVIQMKKKSAVFRLKAALPDGAAVIAKCCHRETARLERMICREILPTLPITALHYYGYLETREDKAWGFSDDAGRQRFWPSEESHRVLAAQWLGTLHGLASRTKASEMLPRRGSAFYLNLLHVGRENIQHNLTKPQWTSENVRLLEGIVMQLDWLEAHWQLVQAGCQVLPSTLVHGDFRPKNVHVRSTKGGLQLFVLDWETAGWGMPAVDLAPSRGQSLDAHVDLVTYLAKVHPFWPDLTLPALRYAIQLGRLFRRLAAVYWSSQDLEHEWVEKSIGSMQVLQEELRRAVRDVFGEDIR